MDGFLSWVPKWYETGSASLIGGSGCFLAGLCDSHFPYLAILHDKSFIGPSNRPEVLSLDGYVVDQIQTASDVMTFEISDEPSYSSQLFGTPFSSLTPRSYRNGEMLQIAFCKSPPRHLYGGHHMLWSLFWR